MPRRGGAIEPNESNLDNVIGVSSRNEVVLKLQRTVRSPHLRCDPVVRHRQDRHADSETVGQPECYVRERSCLAQLVRAQDVCAKSLSPTRNHGASP